MQQIAPLLTNGYLRIKRCRHGFFAYNINDAAVGRSLDLYGEWCEAELELLGSMLHPGDVVLDVGANIGTHTLFFSRAVGASGQVVAFEPQHLAFSMLTTNVVINCAENVHCFRIALGDRTGPFVFPRLDPHAVQNFGMVGAQHEGEGDKVQGMTIDTFEMARCNLIKIDVEGMETLVVHGARETLRTFRPILFVENDRPEYAPALIAKVQECGYRCWWHLSEYFNPRNFFRNPENGYGALLSVNMLCLPEEAAFELPAGLEPALTGDTPAEAVRRRFGQDAVLAQRLVFHGGA